MGKYEWVRRRPSAAVLLFLLLTACSSDNGLPGDLVEHLQARGLKVQPTRQVGPISKRTGYIVAKYDDRLALEITSNLRMQRLMVDNPQWLAAKKGLSGVGLAEQLWGIWARPKELKLSDGRQLEYLFLLVTPEGEMVLLSAYSET